MAKIYLDPGHGGNDPGAVGNGLQEKDVTLAIALKVRNYLNTNYSGHSIRMSRTTDTAVSLAQRTNDANNWGADYFVSIHINAGGGTGYEDYIHSNLADSSTTAQYRNLMHEEIMKQVDFRNRGKKKANFHVLRESAMSAILTENGFIDTVADANKLKSDAYLNRIALGYANGIARVFNLPPAGGQDTYTVQPGDTLWSISRALDMTVQELKDLNGLTEDTIYPGQVLIVRGTGFEQGPVYHIVQAGETLWRIAQEYETTVEAIKSLNGLSNETIQPGQRLQVK